MFIDIQAISEYTLLQGVPQISFPFVLVLFSASYARTEDYFIIIQ